MSASVRPETPLTVASVIVTFDKRLMTFVSAIARAFLQRLSSSNPVLKISWLKFFRAYLIYRQESHRRPRVTRSIARSTIAGAPGEYDRNSLSLEILDFLFKRGNFSERIDSLSLLLGSDNRDVGRYPHRSRRIMNSLLSKYLIVMYALIRYKYGIFYSGMQCVTICRYKRW